MGKLSRQAAAGILVPCVAVIAFFLVLIPQVVRGPLGLTFLVGALIGGALVIITLRREGQSWLRASIITIIITAFTFAMMYLPMWYLVVYIPSTGKPLFQFQNSR